MNKIDYKKFLSPAHIEILDLWDIYKSYTKLSQKLKISPSAVKEKYNRAKRNKEFWEEKIKTGTKDSIFMFVDADAFYRNCCGLSKLNLVNIQDFTNVTIAELKKVYISTLFIKKIEKCLKKYKLKFKSRYEISKNKKEQIILNIEQYKLKDFLILLKNMDIDLNSKKITEIVSFYK